MSTDVERHIVADRNASGYIEGADPKLKDEVIHRLRRTTTMKAPMATPSFSGADDDGSGTVALLEIAEAYAMAAEANARPRRSVLFACWEWEERGPLLGSWAYTEAPTFPLERTVACPQHGHGGAQRGSAWSVAGRASTASRYKRRNRIATRRTFSATAGILNSAPSSNA